MIISSIYLNKCIEGKSRRDGSNIGVMLNLIQRPLFQGIAGQARNDGASEAPKSRRDDPLLTVGFNLRTINEARVIKVPQGRYFSLIASGVLAGLCRLRALPDIRRLKPSVNKMPSLRDLFLVVFFLFGKSLYAQPEDEAIISSPPTYEKDSFGAIVRKNPDRKVIHLIFSADETFEGAQHIIQTMDKERIKGSFFLTGNCLRNEKYKPVILEIIQKGHFTGAHSDRHLLYAPWDDRQLSLVAPDSLIADLRQNMVELEKYGVDISKVNYYLSPYEWYNQEHVRLIESEGQKVINFTPGLRTAADYTTPEMPNYKSSQELLDQLFEFEKEKGLNGAIILIHPGTDGARVDKLYLRLDEIIVRLKKIGYDFERL